MRIDAIENSVMVPVAFALSMIAALWAVGHVARRYPSIPKRIPARILLDGRPSKHLVGKRFVWLAPSILTAAIAALGVMVLFVRPPDEPARPLVALAFLICAEAAYLVAWLTDRQIELARKMTYRVAPMRTFRAALPVLLTTAVVLVIAARL